ncbi:cysteine desulfurase family protein [Litoribacter ruber]|uniref:cysteine desulfurase family protein n=1 Tax=Litoribacter ruber TaxID=702568 RepID=UPI001FEBEEA0|nr:cysteine desulfurase family protein [Litoribacter ruber]
MISKPIYLDYNSTTPCDPRVVEAMLPYFSGEFGNPASRDHLYGWNAKDAVDEAREQVAALVGAHSEEIIFTSGATEAINMALKGLAVAAPIGKNHIITCHTEHNAVLDTCAYLEKKGLAVSYLGVDSEGNISLEELEGLIRPETLCISLMWANNETGVIHPIEKIGHLAQKHHVAFFCDATQAVGKIPVNVQEAGITLMAFSAHKMYGPKGIGALYLNKKSHFSKISPLLNGGSHEHGLRSGTLNVPGIVGFGQAARLCAQEMTMEHINLGNWRNKLEKSLMAAIPEAKKNGSQNRLPHVSNISFPQINAENLLLSLSQHLALSRGSACTSNVQRPSHVLKAMGLGDAEAFGSIRISLGRFTKEVEIELVIEKLTAGILSFSPTH